MNNHLFHSYNSDSKRMDLLHYAYMLEDWKNQKPRINKVPNFTLNQTNHWTQKTLVKLHIGLAFWVLA